MFIHIIHIKWPRRKHHSEAEPVAQREAKLLQLPLYRYVLLGNTPRNIRIITDPKCQISRGRFTLREMARLTARRLHTSCGVAKQNNKKRQRFRWRVRGWRQEQKSMFLRWLSYFLPPSSCPRISTYTSYYSRVLHWPHQRMESQRGTDLQWPLSGPYGSTRTPPSLLFFLSRSM